MLDDAQDEDVAWVRVIAGERAPAGLIVVVRGAGVSGWPDSVSAQRRRAVRPTAGAVPSMFPVMVKGVDDLCRMQTVFGLVQQRELAPGPARVW